MIGLANNEPRRVMVYKTIISDLPELCKQRVPSSVRFMLVSGLLERGLALFNNGSFYEAHEVWEDLWRETPPGPLRRRYQGLVQAAVAFHHIGSGNALGGRGLLPKARHNLGLGAGSEPGSLDIAGLSGELEHWLDLLEKDSEMLPQTLPPFPRIRRLK